MISYKNSIKNSNGEIENRQYILPKNNTKKSRRLTAPNNSVQYMKILSRQSNQLKTQHDENLYNDSIDSSNNIQSGSK